MGKGSVVGIEQGRRERERERWFVLTTKFSESEKTPYHKQLTKYCMIIRERY